MREPNRLAFAGDWHSNDEWAVACIEYLASQDVDTIVHVGDYGFNFRSKYTQAVEKACTEHDIMLYFIDGNHDNHPWIWSHPTDEDGLYVVTEHVRYLPRGYRWQWWGKSLVAIGGATSVDKQWRKPGESWWPTEALSKDDVATLLAQEPVDVWVSHDAPVQIAVPGITKDDFSVWPRQAILDAQAHRELLSKIFLKLKPKLVVHGHYHVPYRTYFNNTLIVGLDRDESSFVDNLLIAQSEADLIVGDNWRA